MDVFKNKFLDKNLLRIILFFVSLIIVGFGQPALYPPFGLIAASIGYALFWIIIIDNPSWKARFWLSTLWFALVAGIEHFWFLSHPYLYIYPFYLLLITGLGIQFGIIGVLISRRRLEALSQVFAIAALWTIMEWGRLFLLSGFSWGPVGLALSSHDYPRQFASFWGVYGLSFWVFLTNLLALRWYIHTYICLPKLPFLRSLLLNFSMPSKFINKSAQKVSNFSSKANYARSLLDRKKWNLAAWGLAALFPFIYGGVHIAIHQAQTKKSNQELSVLLVQTAFPVEETMAFESGESAIAFVLGEWEQILRILQKHREKKINLIVLPEYVVLYGTYYPVFDYKKVTRLFQQIFGASVIGSFPNLEEHLAAKMEFQDHSPKDHPVWMVNNAFFAQAIANIFSSDVVLGLEDSDYISDRERINYNAALHITPDGVFSRYEKQVLVPMGEYIPFSFCKALAARYGVGGSFTHGEGAKLFQMSGNGKIPFGLSICYEETYGHLMRSNKKLGAKLLVNITNDGWYPDSLLPKQHFEHARLRAVEMGIPLVRSCNTGVTAAVDSLGRTIAQLGDEGSNIEAISDGLYAVVPIEVHQTPFTLWGDHLIVILCIFLLLIGAILDFFQNSI
jgi:apolipoprotein N-acyltransferase